MSESIYTSDFSKYLPYPLQQDEKMTALAKAAAEELLKVSGLMDNVLIYSRIDELPEALVDVLAYDMHVDWYDYSYPLAAKRDLLKTSVMVHKKMGTKYSVEKALSALYPESEVEEWYEYGGEPGYFRIVCDVTDSRIVASYSDIIRAVRLYKRLSAHMEEVAYQAHVHCEIRTHTDYWYYRSPLTGRLSSGEYPQRNIHGENYGSNIVVGTEAAGFIFVSPAAGTLPYRNMIFQTQTAHIDAETALNVFGYRNIPTGRKNAGESPQRSHRGGNAGATVLAEDTAAAYHFTSRVAGTVPERNTVQRTEGGAVESTTAANAFRFSVKQCGSTRKL